MNRLAPFLPMAAYLLLGFVSHAQGSVVDFGAAASCFFALPNATVGVPNGAPTSNAGQVPLQGPYMAEFNGLDLNLVFDRLYAPEPVSGLLAACGLVAFGGLRRRKVRPVRATPPSHRCPPQPPAY